MLNIFIGYDPRVPMAYNVLQHSIVRHASKPVAITPLILSQLPIKRRGLTEFTYSRFLVPYLCGYEGVGIFMDSDIVVTGDIYEMLPALNLNAVSVMKNQPEFEWASVMLFVCGACRNLTPEFIDDEQNRLFDMAWAKSVGSIADEWNHCVGYQQPKDAKLYHFTQGLPHWPETQGLQEDAAWHEEHQEAMKSVGWYELMGKSVHAPLVLKRMLGRYGVKIK